LTIKPLPSFLYAKKKSGMFIMNTAVPIGNEKSLLSMVAIPVKPPFIMPFGARKLFTDTAYKMPPPKK
jgi:hypothetical protein